MPDVSLLLPFTDMIVTLRWPLALFAVLLPILIRALLKPAPIPQASLRYPHLRELNLEDQRLLSWQRYRVGLAALAFIALSLAAAKPVMIGDETHIPRTGRDLMLVIDISQSMGLQDWGAGTTRMNVVKHVVGNFIKRRYGDRVGIVLFGSRAYLQTPLTFDLHAIELQLNETLVGLAGPATALGDGIGLTIKHLRDANAHHKVMVLISDGAANAGRVTAQEAARIAVDFGLRVYTIGVGSVAHNDADNASFDGQLLRSLADATGGQFFEARMRSELEAVYRALDELEPATIESEIVRRQTELYPWPLAFALLLVLLLFVGESRTKLRGRSQTA